MKIPLAHFLREYVQEFETHSGLIKKLAHNAYSIIEQRCCEAAKKGLKSLVVEEIEYVGSRGGNASHRAAVTKELVLKLRAECLDVTVCSDEKMIISWSKHV